jgi:hypothetical protein
MMMRTSEIDMANSDEPADIDTLINNAAWAICKTYQKILKASPGAAQTLEHDKIFDVPFIAHWYIGE